jgi:hypothetical protein
MGTAVTNLRMASLATIGGDLTIGYNDALVSIASFHSLTTIDGDFFLVHNPDLTSLAGLSTLSSVGGQLSISDHEDLTDFGGLQNLTSVGALYVWYNDALTSLDGLTNLTSIGDFFGCSVVFEHNYGLCQTRVEAFVAGLSASGSVEVNDNKEC